MSNPPRAWYRADFAKVANDGTATVMIVMPSSGIYDIDTATVSLSDRNATASAIVYRDAVSQITQVDATSRGGGDTSNTPHHLEEGQALIAVWSGGTPGSTAAFRVAGTYTPR